MEKGYKFGRSICHICGAEVADNWYIRHMNDEHTPHYVAYVYDGASPETFNGPAPIVGELRAGLTLTDWQQIRARAGIG
jgi:hypothetical protein